MKKLSLFISSIADTPNNTADEKRQHSFLIYIGMLMSLGGLLWGSISLYADLHFQAMIPYGYALTTLINFTYLYFSKNFNLSQGIQLFISILLPFLFQLSLGGFISSGAMVLWSILAILGAFTFKKTHTTIVWFFLYLAVIIASGLLDQYVRVLALDVPLYISILFFTINISVISSIIFTLFYYFVDSEKKYRESLEENLSNLKMAQDQLIESEKMSSLGSLVAGVAHEVNTPLGISITAASIFENEIKTLEKAIEENTLSKSALVDFIKNIKTTDDLLMKNLNRAALLIKNFKKISVDQSSDDLRDFELNTYIQEVASTLNNELKHKNITLNLELEDKAISMFSYPGAISQVIINLIHNCIVHAFDGIYKKDIIIQTRMENDNVIILCSDNGRGVDASIEDKIFEPFITTKRNQGGTGLGLNITYNLVSQQLKGSISHDKSHTQGTSFILKLPCSLSLNPEKKDYDI